MRVLDASCDHDFVDWWWCELFPFVEGVVVSTQEDVSNGNLFPGSSSTEYGLLKIVEAIVQVVGYENGSAISPHD